MGRKSKRGIRMNNTGKRGERVWVRGGKQRRGVGERREAEKGRRGVGERREAENGGCRRK